MKRIDSLSGLRILAAAMITLYHMEFFENSPGVMGVLHHAFSGFGSMGVTIFILLSGFLNMFNYNPSKFSAGGYVRRKIVKVYPLHLLTMLATMAYLLVTSQMTVSQCVVRLFPQLLMVQAFIPFESFYFSFNKLSWYLSLFLLFCIVDRPLLKWMSQVSKKQLGFLIVAVLAFQFSWFAVFGASSYMHWFCYIDPFFRLSDYIFGVALGGVFKFRDQTANPALGKSTFLETTALIILFAALPFKLLLRHEFYRLVYTAVAGFVIYIFSL